jgi:dTDP-4-dehydrorhamnose reductase
MRVWLTGGTGFVGSNIVHAAVGAGHEVMTTVRSFVPDPAPCAIDRVDMTDRAAVAHSVRSFDPDLVVHCAILNDHEQMHDDRTAAWDAYVEATRYTAEAAAASGAAFVVVSTDWVFDGTSNRSTEDTPPNPVNLYGTLKMASEIVALERDGAVARVSGVNGLHRARPGTPREQDQGFGYFVASLVDSLRAGQPFEVWESHDINMIATPSLADECAEIILAIGARRETGIFHCCGADATTRLELAHLACDVFDLDPDLLRSARPPVVPHGTDRIPFDTSLATPRTDEVLDRSATPARTLLERFRAQYPAPIVEADV